MTAITGPRGYPIGKIALKTGIKVETVRYYERIGLMPEPSRTAGGNRQYDDTHLKRLSFIRHGRQLGFSIAEIRAMLAMVDRRDFTCAEVHAMTVEHLASVDAKIANLTRLRRTLDAMARQCSAGDTPDCPILDTLFEAA